MAKLFLIAAIVAVTLGGASIRTSKQPLLFTEDQVDQINAKATTWTADFDLVKDLTEEEAQGMIGTYLTPSDYPEADWGALIENFQAPASFDARVKWPDCVNYIRNQKQCGSCWAFGATEALSDRFCIKGHKVLLSPQYLVSCDTGNYGCNGGHLDVAWRYIENHGIPSDTCVSYKSGDGDSGTCPRTCDDGSALRRHKTIDIRNFSNPSSIQLEVMAHGPIEVAFTVYHDFYAYKSGIYKHTSGSSVGGHAVKLVGWGQENGVNYWICANSWGVNWGEKGYFRIAWGQVGIDRYGIAGVPALS
jgi:cathepsin B